MQALGVRRFEPFQFYKCPCMHDNKVEVVMRLVITSNTFTRLPGVDQLCTSTLPSCRFVCLPVSLPLSVSFSLPLSSSLGTHLYGYCMDLCLMSSAMSSCPFSIPFATHFAFSWRMRHVPLLKPFRCPWDSYKSSMSMFRLARSSVPMIYYAILRLVVSCLLCSAVRFIIQSEI